MSEWIVFLRGLALGLLVAFMLGVTLRFRQYYAMRLLALFALCISGYVLVPLVYGRTDWFFLVVLLADSVPLMFLLFTQALFNEHRSPDRRSLLVGALYLVLGYVGLWFPDLLAVEAAGMSALRLASRLIMPLMVVYALFLTLRHWQQDLVQPRRLLRATIMLTVGAYIFGVIVVENVVNQNVPGWVDVGHSAGIVLSTLLFMTVAIALGPEGLAAASQVTGSVSRPPARAMEDPELTRIVEAMERDHAYRDMDLTIRRLGERLSIPEHRLRQHINQQLNYRNFNDFLNYFRLGEVRRRLADPADRQIPILTIAMDAGYRSLTTFNRAFKSNFGVTPRDFRESN
jgi:AraC-like DNA-binding protein